MNEPIDSSPVALSLDQPEALQALLETLEHPPGSLGIVAGAPGVGKSVLLVRLAAAVLQSGRAVLHLVQPGPIERIRQAFEEAGFVEGEQRLRVIQISHRLTTPDALESTLEMLSSTLGFRPYLVVVDEPRPAQESLFDGFKKVLSSRGCHGWFAVTGLPKALPSGVNTRVSIMPVGARLELEIQSADHQGHLAWDGRLCAAETTSPHPPETITLYSGGALGTEAAFGEAAERWGLREVNFTFDGHQPVRRRGLVHLSESEMTAGDVSLLYVSRRMNRTYRDGSHIRKVLQSLWHQVHNAQAIFVVGVIQDDDTVTGGTGWAVELARMWSKPLWVFDQDQAQWYFWDGLDWAAREPVIEWTSFVGTGTRNITDAGKAAIQKLFERSFGPR